MKKRFTAVFLSLVMLFASLPTAALAAEQWMVRQIAAPQFDDAESFSEGMALVRLHGKYGFIDRTGMPTIPCIYDAARSFQEGLAAFRVNYQWGFLDREGKVAIPCDYNAVRDFCEGLAAACKGTSYLWGFIDKTGKEIVPGKYDDVGDFSEGLAAVYRRNWERSGSNSTAGSWGFIDQTGKEIVPCKYSFVSHFSDGLAWVKLNRAYGLIDRTGREIIPCKYDNVSYFSEGLAMVERDRKWGYIDKMGQEVIPCQYDFVQDFSEGLAWVRRDDKFGCIDKTGKVIVPCQYDDANSFSEGLAWVQRDEKWGLVDATGKETVPCTCEYSCVWNFSEGYAAVRVGEYPDVRDGFVDRTGKEVIPCKYGYAGGFFGGLARVSTWSKVGFVDKTGREFMYDYVREFSEGVAAVELNRKWGFISFAAVGTAYPSTQKVDVDGKAIEFQCYALKDANGNDTNYIKLRDLADILNGSAVQFEVDWDGAVTITTGKGYTKNGSEQKTPFKGQRAYQEVTAPTLVNGEATDLAAFTLTDDKGGGHTYYKLRDLGTALGFKVDWTRERGIFIETK